MSEDPFLGLAPEVIAFIAGLKTAIESIINAYIWDCGYSAVDPERRFRVMLPSGMFTYHATRKEAAESIMRACKVEPATLQTTEATAP